MEKDISVMDLSDLLLLFHARLKSLEPHIPRSRSVDECDSEELLVKMFGPIISYPGGGQGLERRVSSRARRKSERGS